MSTAAKLAPADGMPSRESTPAPKLSVFQVRRPDTLQFRTIEGMCRMAGVPAHRLRRLIAKEATDNALDACDRTDNPGKASIDSDLAHGVDRYTVTDQGVGIDGDAAALADLFSTGRAMLSGKYWRMATRGVLGNGLRVLCAAVALSGGTITVETRGRRTVLRPLRFGMTEVAEETLSDVTAGTRIAYTLDDTIPIDTDDLADAHAAIDLARRAGPPYARRPSPHWLDADHLAEVFTTIEPTDTTVRQLIEQLDGCTGAMAGRLALPFGKGRLCRDMTEADIATLLQSLREAARVVKARHLGPIGPNAFGDAFDAYIVADATLRVGRRDPRSEIPVLIEALASVTSRKGGRASLRVFCNRSPVVGGASASRSYGSKITLAGAGMDGTSFDAEGGDCELILAVTAPLIPQTSLGKAAHLAMLREPIADALRRAFVRSRNRLPPDPAQPKAPKHEPPPKPLRPPPYEPTGPLAIMLAEAAETAGLLPRDLLVLSPRHDPFNETKVSRRDAEWFTEQVRRFLPTGRVHLRGLYYRCLSAGDVRLPDGSRFVGSHMTADLIENAGKHARHLGLVPFVRIIDERAAPPEFYDTEGTFADPADTRPFVERQLILGGGDLAITLPPLTSLLPTIAATWVPRPRQPYRICFVGEKVSLGAVLRPIAQQVGAELLLLTGEISETQAYGIIARAADDGRPLRILYFSDFDPSGWQMPVSLSRKFQAHIVREFPDVDVRLIRVALTSEQVVQFSLPDSPIKQGEKRAAAWWAKWRRAQVEIDALAALRPELLDQIAREAVAPYFDHTLDARFAKATALPDGVRSWVRRLPAHKSLIRAIHAAHGPTRQAIETLNKATIDAVSELRTALEAADDKPEVPSVAITAEITTPERTDSVFDSADDFVAATRKLQAIKALAPDEDDDTGGTPRAPPEPGDHSMARAASPRGFVVNDKKGGAA
jgi:DNA topoisomerase VI subunit B